MVVHHFRFSVIQKNTLVLDNFTTAIVLYYIIKKNYVKTTSSSIRDWWYTYLSVIFKECFWREWGRKLYPIGIYQLIKKSYKDKKYLYILPSRVGLAFLIQSVKCRTKSKKKSPSGTEITLSAILTNKLKPSADRRLNLCAILEQKSVK